jgi:hypothetical protein
VTILDLAALIPDYVPEHANVVGDAFLDILRHAVELPRLIGVGPLVTATLVSSRELIRIARQQSDAKIVVGGPLCAVPGISQVMAEYLQPDYYVAGDGESAIATIWAAVERGVSPLPEPGVLAVVLGCSESALAKASDPVKSLNSSIKDAGFCCVWNGRRRVRFRKINNTPYRSELISVYQKLDSA